MQAMREELRTLRSLFENQLTLMEWQQMGQVNPCRATLMRRLHGMGFGPDVCRGLADAVTVREDPEAAYRQALELIAGHIPTMAEEIIDRGGVMAVVGPTGVGKTTTVAKLAARFALRHGRQQVALVSTDNFRIGGQEQLRSFARILGVPVHEAADGEELAELLTDLSDRRLVLIDTAGMSQRDMRLAEQFATLAPGRHRVQPYLVLSANTQLPALMETIRAFSAVRPQGCILSKADEASSLGGALTAVMRARLSLAYVADGQRVPEDLSPARADSLVARAGELAAEYGGESEDDESLAVTYRADRGEPRGPHKAGESWEGRGDCIDCKQCIAVCPTGVDIREGFQLECIQCALCIDSCNEVMRKVGRPEGLIAYDTDKNMERRRRGEPTRFRFVRPRTVFYAAILVVVSAMMVYALSTRDPFDVNVLRDRNPVFVQLADGSVRNAYTVKILNKSRTGETFALTVDGLPQATVDGIGVALSDDGAALLDVGADQVKSFRIFLTAQPSDLSGASTPVTLTATRLDGQVSLDVDSVFRAPAP